jgi:hypothetical protein
MNQWQAAASLVEKWLPSGHGSAESQVLTRTAAALLEATIVHLQLVTLSPQEVARQCRAFLEVEQGLSTLLRSHDPLVAGKAKDAVAYGVSWTEIREPKNLVVTTALMNLPKGLESTRGMP